MRAFSSDEREMSYIVESSRETYTMSSSTTRSVMSRDGTTIGYRQFGEGPGIILVHGGARSSYNYTDLGVALSNSFSVYVHDRRGRGMSGPPGENYSIETECGDIDAIRSETDARYIFGLSSGALIALQAAQTLPNIEKVAAYDPPLFTERINPIDWGKRFERELSQGKLGNATITLAEGVEGFPRPLRLIPRSLLAPLIGYSLKISERLGGTDKISASDLIQTMKYDVQMVREAHLLPESFRNLSTEVLLLAGSKSPVFLQETIDELSAVLPCATRVECNGLGHTDPENSGDPERVAQELRRFFS